MKRPAQDRNSYPLLPSQGHLRGPWEVGDELSSAKHRENLPVHLQAVGRHHLASGYVPVIREGVDYGPEAMINLGSRWVVFSLLRWHGPFLFAVAVSVTVEIE
jgi:hypothetical protein